jgi:hypothetical protein
MSPAESAAAYERYISENWDRLSPFEQDQARAYMQAKFEGVQQQQPPQLTPAMHAQPPQMMMPGNPMPGYPNPAPGYASAAPAYGYGMYGGFAPAKREDEGSWAVPVGYIGLLVFTPLAIGCGIYNLTKGRTGHGLAQILIPVALFALVLMAVASGP